MTPEEQELTRKWFRNWQALGPVLEELRWEAIENAETPKAIAAFDGLFETAIRDIPPKPDSGLVEQQDLFKLARE